MKRINQLNREIISQSIHMIYTIIFVGFVSALLAIGYFYMRSPLPVIEKIEATVLPTLILLVGTIFALIVRFQLNNIEKQRQGMLIVVLVTYVGLVIFYFQRDIIPLIILMIVVFGYMNQVILSVRMLFTYYGLALVSMVFFYLYRFNETLHIGPGFIVTMLVFLTHGLYVTYRYSRLFEGYTETLVTQFESLSDMQNRSKLLHKASREIIWYYDLKRQERVFPEIAQGESLEEYPISGTVEDWVMNVHPDDAPVLIEGYKKILKGELDYFEAEFRRYYRQEPVTWLAVRTVSLKDPSGDVHMIAGSYTHIQDRKSKELALEAIAYSDTMTGLGNRSAYLRDFEACPSKDELAFLLSIDFTNFREINSTFGHSIGDQLIKTIAQRFKGISDDRVLYRFAGTNFGILSYGPLTKAVEIAEIVTAVCDQAFVVEEKEVFIKSAIGIAGETIAERGDGTLLLRRADSALYHSRRSDQSRYMIYVPDMTQKVHKRIDMLNQLYQARSRNELYMVYQPLYYFVEGRYDLYGFECLIRWNNPNLGMISPDVFIPLAEESGLIHDIGGWVIEEGCRFIQHVYKYQKDLVVSINVSTKQFTSSDFIPTLMNIVGISHIAPRNLCLEITESSVIASFEEVQAKIDYIRTTGISIALDDFGTGYSSLNYLGQLHIDTLKIDKSFTSKVLGESSDYHMIQSVIGLASSLGLKFVAEGVETKEQLAALVQMKCPVFQGYYFSKPISLEDVTAILENIGHHEVTL